jgi:hypothetical protein
MSEHSWHDFGRGLMPERAAVTCAKCGTQMRQTGKPFPHVEFRRKGRTLWVTKRPECMRLRIAHTILKIRNHKVGWAVDKCRCAECAGHMRRARRMERELLERIARNP